MTARVRDTSSRGWKSQTWLTSLGSQVPPLVRPHLHSPANPQSRPEARSTSEQTQSLCPLPAPCSLSSRSVTAGPAPAGLWQSGKCVVWGGKTTCLAVNSVPNAGTSPLPSTSRPVASVAQWLLGTLWATRWRQPQKREGHTAHKRSPSQDEASPCQPPAPKLTR